MLVVVVILFLIPEPDSKRSLFNHDYDKRRNERILEKSGELLDSLNKKLEIAKKTGDADSEYKLNKEIEKLTTGKGNWFTPGMNKLNEKKELYEEKYKQREQEKQQREQEKQREQEQRQQKQQQQQGGYSDLDMEIDGGAEEEGEYETVRERSNYDKAKEQMGNIIPKSKADLGMSVGNILWNCIRFLFVITISVPVGAIFCAAYFIFYSLYAMVYYYDRDFTKIMAVFIDMLKFIDNKKEENNALPTDTTFQLFVKKFYEYLEYISDNFFIIVYLITFFILLGDSQKNISNNTFRNTLYFIDLSFIFIILGYLYYIIKSRFNISSVEDFINLANGSRDPQPKNYDNSASAFNMANYGVYGLTMAGIFYVFWSLVQYNLPKSMQVL
jgi:hypothetical protein